MNDDIDPDDGEAICPICTAPNQPAAQLGNLLHYCCRDCGMWFNHEADPEAQRLTFAPYNPNEE